MLQKFTCTLLLLITLTACGNPGTNPGHDYRQPAMQGSDTLTNLHYPIEMTDLSLNQRYAQYYAEDLLMVECMKETGNTWTPINPPQQYLSADRRRYGIMDLPAASTYGYQLPPPPREASARFARINRLTPEEERAAFGADGRHGCYGKAHKKITGSIPEVDLKLFNELNRKSLQESKKDPAVTQAITSWKECMQDAGYTYSDPFDAAGDPSWSGNNVTKEEVVAAVTDLHCKEKVNLISIWAGREYSLQKEYIQQNSDYFTRITKSKKERLKNIDDLIHDQERSADAMR